jgi:large subunit ribosomal protein L14e
VKRQIVNFKWLALTDIVVKVTRNAKQKTLTKAWEAAKVQETWKATAWAKKIASKAVKAAATDLDRFKLKLQKQKLGAKLKKASAA